MRMGGKGRNGTEKNFNKVAAVCAVVALAAAVVFVSVLLINNANGKDLPDAETTPEEWVKGSGDGFSSSVKIILSYGKTAHLDPSGLVGDVIWVCSAPDILYSDGAGNVRAVGNGAVSVTATQADGEKVKLFEICCVGAPETAADGEADGNGEVDITDAMLVFYHVAKKELLPEDALVRCNVNDDNDVDIADAMAIFYFVAKKTDSVRP